MFKTEKLLNIKEASIWATEHLGKTVTPSNIAYLINYGRVKKRGAGGNIFVAKTDLIDYYKSYKREDEWKKQLGDDLNWALSFEQYKESETSTKKQSKQVRQDYANGIANVLNNCRRFLAKDFDVFLVANDEYNLYPQIAEDAKMQIVNQYKSPVLNRTEKDKGAYSEIIFHLRKRI